MVLNNGLKARLTLWQADDAGHFPVRIEAVEALSSFMIRASLEKVAMLHRCEITDLIPQAELRQYLRER